MTYEQTVDYLYHCMPMFERQGAAGYKEGLDNTLALDMHFQHPHQNFKTIHVAGTNGKGSCSHTLAAILQAQGLKVGLYTSPHIIDFRERIRVDGVPVSKEFVVDFVANHRSFFEPLHPSFFEVVTAMAFKYFSEQTVDIAVVEVGLGGRLDCTNIISPILSIITNISFDHTQFLGDTLAKIAAEKAGIIKPTVPVVIGEATEETRPVFEEKAKKEHSPIYFAEDEPEVLSSETLPEGGRCYRTRSFGLLKGDLEGDYQERNTNTLLCAIKLLSLRPDAVRQGFANVAQSTGLLGRWQTVNEHPKVICDTGHNVGGWQYVAKQLKAQPCHHLHIIIGMVSDKDIDGVMQLLPTDATYYFTKANNHRAIPETTVKEIAKRHGIEGETFADVETAYETAINHAEKDDLIFVGGSSYVVADFLKNHF